jgi:rSAM/selenodomain-associated transferase 1
MPRIAVMIMAKAPRAGEVKTRLCPPLSPAEAAELYRCFLRDKIAQVRALPSTSPFIAFTPADSRPLFEGLAPGFRLIEQEGVDLGSRLRNSLDHVVSDGHAGALAIDSDTPTLPIDFLRRAVALVAAPEIDLVLGPSDDGGYYLIGMRRVRPGLFEEIPWSTAAVLSETIRHAEAEGLRIACLPPWFDVDTPADLARLSASIAGTEGARTAGAGTGREGPAHTRRFFQLRAPSIPI